MLEWAQQRDSIFFLSLFFFLNFLELFVLCGGQLLSVIAEPGIQRQA